MKKIIVASLIISFFVFSSCSKPAEPLTVPEDFVALLDYKQLPDGKNYGAIVVASNNYTGTIKAEGRGKKGSVKIKPGQIKEIPAAFDLVLGDSITITAGDTTRGIAVKYDSPKAFALGFVDTQGAMFTDSTPFMATKGKGRYISVYHIAKSKKTTYGFPGKDTAWYAVSFKNKTTVNDTEGVIIIRKKNLKLREIYYVTTYFYDSDHNYIGGSPAWEAKYMPEE